MNFLKIDSPQKRQQIVREARPDEILLDARNIGFIEGRERFRAVKRETLLLYGGFTYLALTFVTGITSNLLDLETLLLGAIFLLSIVLLLIILYFFRWVPLRRSGRLFQGEMISLKPDHRPTAHPWRLLLTTRFDPPDAGPQTQVSVYKNRMIIRRLRWTTQVEIESVLDQWVRERQPRVWVMYLSPRNYQIL